jgi:CHAD domain-containing protein
MPPAAAKPPLEHGIRYWMQRVVAESERARNGLAAGPVHDLRVALRRCRSLAEGIRAVDPDPRWKEMRRAGRVVFRALGELRDVQVLAEWAARLSEESDPVRQRLLAHCAARELGLKTAAALTLDAFDTREWLAWSVELERRARAVAGSAQVFRVLALEKWTDAWDLHREALRNRTKIGFHTLRIGVKRFRYLVENFLPEQYAAWGKDLKQVQDLLGEVHDLDVLLDTVRAIRALRSEEETERWRRMLARERGERLATYRRRAIGRGSLWQQWRNGLPRGEQLEAGILDRFATWARFLDRDAAHTRRVVGLSLKLHDGLRTAGLLRFAEYRGVSTRDLLVVAATSHEVGRLQGGRGHHKRSGRMLERLEPPPGWTAEHLRIAGLVARYHRGALPAERHAAYRRLPQRARALVNALAGILRLADALAGAAGVRSLTVERTSPWITLRARGYRPQPGAAQAVAGARHLLESSVGRPIMVTGAK